MSGRRRSWWRRKGEARRSGQTGRRARRRVACVDFGIANVYTIAIQPVMPPSVTGFDWDEGNWPKCAKHGVSKSDIEHALSNTPMVRPDLTGRGEPRLNAIGRNAMGRH